MGEDQGLFRSCPVDISLTLLPFSKKSSRGDLIYIGKIDGSEVEVLFAGRRAMDLGPLRRAMRRHIKAPNSDSGIILNAKGVWRTRLVPLNDVETDRIYQFVVAEWSIPNENGGGTVFGEPPLTE